LVVSALLAFMSITGMAGMYNIKKLDPNLLPPNEIYAGTPALFRLSVRNSQRYIPSFLISLGCQSGQSVVFPIVKQSSSCEGSVMLTFSRRGVVPAGQVTISSTYPVGFFRRYLTFETDEQFTVFPALIADRYPDSSEESPLTGTALRRERGIEGELEQIYQYSGAEPLRTIHWKLSARSNDLLVKGFGSRSARPMLIDLALLPGQGVEERISRAAWLVRHLVSKRPVGLIFGSRVIPAGCGKQHELMLLTELALYGSD
jgi:uncharacterized protein (DUF58 family)